MNKLLDLEEILELIGRLRNGFESYANAHREAGAEAARELVRLERQHQHARRQLKERHESLLTDAQNALQDRKSTLLGHLEKRQARIARARASVEDQRSKKLAHEESRQVFQVQRELLQTSRNRDALIQQADAQHAEFSERWHVAAEELAALQQSALGAFRAYPELRRRLENPDSTASEPAPDADQQLQSAITLTQQARDSLKAYRRLLLPRLFSVAPLWLILFLLAAICGGAVPLLRFMEGPPLDWMHAGIAFAASAIFTTILYVWSRRHSAPAAGALIGLLHQASQLHAIAGQSAEARHQQSHDRARQDADARTAALEQEWNQALQTGEHERTALRGILEQKSKQAQATLDRRRAAALGQHESQAQIQIDQINAEADHERVALDADYAGKHGAVSQRLHSRQKQLETELLNLAQPGYEQLQRTREAAQQLSPGWSADYWQEWTPPAVFVPAVPFGELSLELARVAGGATTEELSKLPGASRVTAPLLLTLPQDGAIWFETGESGRELAVGALNNLVLRLLAGAPPGRVAFTIVDPVSLGQNFAGLMHLADHADRLINRRIWTQPEQIDQQLSDLNEHIEKVTQLYLRNEYASIAEYNEQAGRVAEAYQFLVIADFPAGFTDLAARRLLSILASGPRCGVFTLIHWDRRKPLPAEFAVEDLRKSGVWLESSGTGLQLRRPAPPSGLTLRLEDPPDAVLTTALLQRIGRSSIEAFRVELPFSQITPDAPDLWSLETTAEIRVPVGITGATKLQYLALGKGTRQHALIAGKTGSGKSTLFHVVITNLALWAGPDQVEFYLVDFKKGVEFKCYATHRLPHARVVAIESDREFAVSVLERLDEELRKRGDLFRQQGVQDLPGYQRAGGATPLPRTLLIIDEFQEFFTEDDRVAQNAALLLDRLVRQGRAFGIHVLLGSQTLGGAYTLARTTLGQMTIRIALQCNQADALLIMDDDNPAPRLLSRPGEAIYNDAAGAIEGNHPFQVAWLSDEERDEHLLAVRQHADQYAPSAPAPVVFEGNAPADIRDNPLLADTLSNPAAEIPVAPRFWLGAPNSIKGPTEIALRRQSGNNVLFIGLYEETILALMGASLVALAAQHTRDAARFTLLDCSPKDSAPRMFLEQLAGQLPHKLSFSGPAETGETLRQLTEDLERRAAGPAQPAHFVFVNQVTRFKALRLEDEFSISLDESGPNPGQQFNRLLSDGPPLGIHILCSCDTYNNATRFFGRKTLTEFELRVLFQMSAADSASLIDSPKAAALGLHRALLYNVQAGSLETFRPYALPDRDWIQQAGSLLNARQ